MNRVTFEGGTGNGSNGLLRKWLTRSPAQKWRIASRSLLFSIVGCRVEGRSEEAGRDRRGYDQWGSAPRASGAGSGRVEGNESDAGRTRCKVEVVIGINRRDKTWIHREAAGVLAQSLPAG